MKKRRAISDKFKLLVMTEHKQEAQGNIKDAIHTLQKAKKIGGKEKWIFQKLGQLYEATGRKKYACACYIEMVKLYQKDKNYRKAQKFRSKIHLVSDDPQVKKKYDKLYELHRRREVKRLGFTEIEYYTIMREIIDIDMERLRGIITGGPIPN